MNEPSSASRTPFIIILILLLAITGVQYFFNFNGLGTDAAMDHAQIARNVARGQGMTTNWLRPIQMVSGSTRAGLNPFLSDAQIHEQEAIRAGQGETLVDPEKFNPYALRDTRNAPLNILTEAAVFRMAGVHKFDLWSMTGSSMIYLPDRIVAGISCMFFILSVLSCYYILLRMFDVTIACFTCLTMILSNLFLQYATSGFPQMMMLFFFARHPLFVHGPAKQGGKPRIPVASHRQLHLFFMRLPYRMDRAVAHGRFSDFCRHPVQTARPVLHSGPYHSPSFPGLPHLH